MLIFILIITCTSISGAVCDVSFGDSSWADFLVVSWKGMCCYKWNRTGINEKYIKIAHNTNHLLSTWTRQQHVQKHLLTVLRVGWKLYYMDGVMKFIFLFCSSHYRVIYMYHTVFFLFRWFGKSSDSCFWTFESDE